MIRIAKTKAYQRTYWVVTLALFCAAVGVGVWFSTPGFVSDPPFFPLEVDGSHLDFGTAFTTDRFCWSVPVRNLSPHEVVVTEIVTSCKCVTELATPFIVPGEGTSQLSLLLDLTSDDPNDMDLPLRQFQVYIRALVRNQMPASCPRWRVHGTVSSPLRYLPAHPAFSDDSLVRGCAFRPLCFDVVGHDGLCELTVKPEDTKVEAEIEPKSDQAACFKVTVTGNENLEPGNHEFRLSFAGNTRGGTAFEGVLLTVPGTVVDDLEILPSILLMGPTPLGQTRNEQVTLRSRSGTPFEVSGVFPDGQDVSLGSVTKENEGMGKKIQMPITPTKAGAQRSTILFEVTQKTQPVKRTVALQVVYYGTMASSETGLQAENRMP